METTVSKEAMLELKLSLTERLKGKPYFYDVRVREDNSFCIIVENHCNTYFVKETARKFAKDFNVNTTYEKVNSLGDYLRCFSFPDEKNPLHEYAEACNAINFYMKKMQWSDVYRNVYLRENGGPVSAVDFACRGAEGALLYIYKLALSRGHKKRKRNILLAAADFFERRFSKDFQEVVAYTVYVVNGKINFQQKFERKH